MAETNEWREWPEAKRRELLAQLQARNRIGATEPEYHPRGASALLQTSEEPEVILTGPRGTGKSRACLNKVWRSMCEYPGARAAIVRKTRASLSTTGLVTFENEVLGLGHPLLQDGPKREGRASYRLDNGSEIVLLGMDKPSRTLSSEYDLIFVMQAEELAMFEWETLGGGLRNGVMPYQQLMGDCNPETPFHWIKQREESGRLALWETYHQDNPKMWDADKEDWTQYGEDYIARLDRLSGARKLRWLYGKWAAPEGAIYNFEEDAIAQQMEIPLGWPRFVGVDPMGQIIAALWVAMELRQGPTRLHVYDEYYEPYGLTTPEHVKKILEQTGKATVFKWVGGGPSERQARLDWQAAGIPLDVPPFPDVWVGIDRVQQLLSDGTLVIHKNCTNLIGELGAYRRKLVRGEFTDNIEDKEAFHALDSLRYIIAWMTEGHEETRLVYDAKPIW